jgi:hypothetical protein
LPTRASDLVIVHQVDQARPSPHALGRRLGKSPGAHFPSDHVQPGDSERHPVAGRCRRCAGAPPSGLARSALDVRARSRRRTPTGSVPGPRPFPERPSRTSRVGTSGRGGGGPRGRGRKGGRRSGGASAAFAADAVTSTGVSGRTSTKCRPTLRRRLLVVTPYPPLREATPRWLIGHGATTATSADPRTRLIDVISARRCRRRRGSTSR